MPSWDMQFCSYSNGGIKIRLKRIVILKTRTFNILTLLFLSFFNSTGHASVCNCEQSYSFKEQFEKSEKIFSGTVIEVVTAKEEFWPPWMKNTFTRITIQVDQYWKGSVWEKETIEWNSYCRYYLKKSDKLIFFVNSGFPYDWAGCGLTNRVEKSKEVFDELGAGSTQFSRDWTFFYIGGVLSALALSVILFLIIRKVKGAHVPAFVPGARQQAPVKNSSATDKMDIKHIRLSDIEPGLIYGALCTSYKGWDEFSKWKDEWRQFDKDVHDFPDSIGNSGFGTLLGFDFVGFISWDPRQHPSHVIIGHNCVLPEYRNRGIGKHQITRALNMFEKDGFLSVRVSTKRDQFFTNARKMYKSCGFVECAPYGSDGKNMIYYSKKI